MKETDYIKSKLTTIDRIKGWLFLVPASVLMLGITVALAWGMEEVPRMVVIVFVVMFPVAVWSHMSVSAKVERLRREYYEMEG